MIRWELELFFLGCGVGGLGRPAGRLVSTSTSTSTSSSSSSSSSNSSSSSSSSRVVVVVVAAAAGTTVALWIEPSNCRY